MSGARVVRLVPLVCGIACAGNPAPAGFLPSPKEAGSDVYGGWIEVTLPAGKHDSTVAGELIAVRDDSVWILPDDGGVTALATSSVTRGRLAWYHSQTGSVAGFAALGTLSTVANGYFLALTAPAWIITGVVAASSESRAPLRDRPPLKWADLAAYARFPQGLPPGIRLAEIRPKPVAAKARASNP